MKKITLFSAICLLVYCLNYIVIRTFVWFGENVIREHVKFFGGYYIALDLLFVLAIFSIALFFIKLYNKQK